jgi:hypothetical protein
LQVRQAGKVLQAAVCDPGARESYFLQAGEPAHLRQTGVADARAHDVQDAQLLEGGECLLQRFFERLSKNPEPENPDEARSATSQKADLVDEELARLGI